MATTLPNKWQAQQIFWEGFGIRAYDERTVPDDANLPYLTYEAVGGDLGGKTQVSASVWYRSNSWQEASLKADQIAYLIQESNVPAIKIDNGYMKVRLPDGSPYAQRMDEPSDRQIRRVRLTVEIEFLTAY